MHAPAAAHLQKRGHQCCVDDAVRAMAIVFDQVHEASEAVHGFVTERVVQGVRQVLGRSVDSDMPPYLLDDDEEEKKQEKRSSVSERGRCVAR